MAVHVLPLRIISCQICTHFLKLLLFSHNALYSEPRHPILLNFPQKAETRVEHLTRYLYEQMSETLIKTDRPKRELLLPVTEKAQAYSQFGCGWIQRFKKCPQESKSFSWLCLPLWNLASTWRGPRTAPGLPILVLRGWLFLSSPGELEGWLWLAQLGSYAHPWGAQCSHWSAL